MKKIFSYRWTFFLFFIFFFHSPVLSQKKILGLVLDEDHQPVNGATISIRGSNIGTSSDADGNFSITANPGDVLEVSSVGLIRKEIKISTESITIVILSFAVSNMDEVMVIGYGTTKRKDLTGSVSKLFAKEFNTGIITNPLQQLQGKVAGVVITQPGGDPNGDLTTRIRGATSLEGQPPLLVIDGIAIDDFNKAIATLHPAEIETYDILKDASAAAIYGARGANGVILITTKKANYGNVSTDYNGFISIEKIANQLSMLDADQWRKATLTTGGPAFDRNANTNWQKAITQTAFSHSHSVGLSGGNDRIKFRGALGYIRQEGIVINSGKEMINGRLTVSQKSLKEKLEIRYNLNASVIQRDFLPDQSSTGQARTGGAFVFNQAIGYLPVWPIYNPDGSYYQPPTNNLNPLFLLNELYSKQRENFFQGSVMANYSLGRQLTIGMVGALSRGNDVYDRFWPAFAGLPSIASKINHNKKIFSGDVHSSYLKTFAKHSIEFTGVYEYNSFVNDGFGVTAKDFLVPDLLNNNLGAANSVQAGDIFSYKNEVRLISFLGRLIYNYSDRYIFTINFRRDGSSKFGSNNRWGNFPSAAFAWTISRENFFQNADWLGHLKLRVSYGLTGNQENLPSNSFQLLYGPSGPYLYNGQFFQSYAVVQEENPDLKWEVRKSFNVGLDFSLFANRVNGSMDVFHDKTSDILYLYGLPQPPFLTNQVYANAAEAINKGIEMTLAWCVIDKTDVKWIVKGNLATVRNRITNLSGKFRGSDVFVSNPHYGYADGSGYSGAYVSELRTGYPLGVFWLPQHVGLNDNGQEIFNNYDSFGKLIGTSTNYTDQDRVFIDPTPDFTWGLTSTFKYKKLDLSIFVRGVQGQKIFANSLMVSNAIINLPGTNVMPGALTNGFSEQPVPSTYWIRNGSYARLDNVSLGYNFNKLKTFTKIRLYITATNLFVITGYDGIDPEIITEGTQRHIDSRYYPKTQGVTFGVNLEF